VAGVPLFGDYYVAFWPSFDGFDLGSRCGKSHRQIPMHIYGKFAPQGWKLPVSCSEKRGMHIIEVVDEDSSCRMIEIFSKSELATNMEITR
jgi:hypothetical protein